MHILRLMCVSVALSPTPTNQAAVGSQTHYPSQCSRIQVDLGHVHDAYYTPHY